MGKLKRPTQYGSSLSCVRETKARPVNRKSVIVVLLLAATHVSAIGVRDKSVTYAHVIMLATLSTRTTIVDTMTTTAAT